MVKIIDNIIEEQRDTSIEEILEIVKDRIFLQEQRFSEQEELRRLIVQAAAKSVSAQ